MKTVTENMKKIPIKHRQILHPFKYIYSLKKKFLFQPLSSKKANPLYGIVALTQRAVTTITVHHK